MSLKDIEPQIRFEYSVLARDLRNAYTVQELFTIRTRISTFAQTIKRIGNPAWARPKINALTINWNKRYKALNNVKRPITILPITPEPPVPDGSYYLYGSGDNTKFQLLEPFYHNIYEPQITQLDDVVQIVGADEAIFALKSDNTLWAWGLGENPDVYYNRPAFNLFNNQATASAVPIQLSGSWSKIAAAGSCILGIKTDGTLWGWGHSNIAGYGALKNQYNITTTSEQTQLNEYDDWIDISTNGIASAGIRSINGNTMAAWGWQPGGISYDPGWESIVVGSGVLFGIKTDGTLWSVGQGGALLGQGPSVYQLYSFTQIGSDTDWKNVAVCSTAYGAAFGLKDTGELYSWGRNEAGALGQGDYVDRDVPTRIGTDLWKYIAPSSRYLVHAIKSDDTLWGWGSIDRYASADSYIGYGGAAPALAPIQIGTDSNWEVVFDTFSNYPIQTTFAIKTNGTVYGWGKNVTDEGANLLGYEVSGSVVFTETFAQLSNTTNEWVSGSSFARNDSYFVIKSDSTLWGWGENGYGQLGLGNRNFSTQLRQVGSDTWKVASMGFKSAAGITTDGKLYTWGNNFDAQLGTGDFDDRLIPTWIEQDSTWKSVSVGQYHTLAVKSDGTLWTWGSGSLGVMGLGENESIRTSPVQIGSDSNWSSVYALSITSFGIKDDGSLYGWGLNEDYGLGLENDVTIYNTPTFVDAGPWASLTLFDYTTYGIKTDGTLWGWGENDGIIPSGPPADQGITGAYNSTSLLTDGLFSGLPETSTRIVTTAGACTTSSLSNSLIGPASLTMSDDPTTGNNDDGFWEVSLPFSIEYNGSTYSTIYVSTNSYITFTEGSTTYSPSADYPEIDKIFISAYDNYGYKIYYGQEGNTFRIRFEGNSEYDESGGNKIWEMVFYQNTSNQIDIHIGENGNFTTPFDNPILTPSQIGTDTWNSVSVADSATFFDQQSGCAVKSDGTLWVWGDNTRGQLGIPSGNSNALSRVGSDTDWKLAFIGESTGFGLKGT